MAATSYQGDPTAVMGRRILAYLLDTLLALLIIVPVGYPMLRDAVDTTHHVDEAAASQVCDIYNDTDRGTLGDQRTRGANDGICVNVGDTTYVLTQSDIEDVQGPLTLLGLGFALVNLILLQGLVGGSVGKLALGLRVVRADGRRIGIGWAVLRWVLLFVDSFCCAIIGLVTAFSSKGHRRVGDMAAGTFVVRRDQMGTPLTIPGLTAPVHQPYPPYQGGGAAGWPAGPAATSSWTPPGDATTVAPGSAAGADGPTWDAARNAYIQWDPAQGAWVQWDDASSSWRPISQ